MLNNQKTEVKFMESVKQLMSSVDILMVNLNESIAKKQLEIFPHSDRGLLCFRPIEFFITTTSLHSHLLFLQISSV